jgi:hypothetical protein
LKAVSAVMIVLMVARFFPLVWQVGVGRLPDGLFEYSPIGAWNGHSRSSADSFGSSPPRTEGARR